MNHDKPMPRPVVVHELYFVVPNDKLENLREIPRVGYVNLEEAIQILDNRKDFSIKSFYYIWNAMQRNLLNL